MKTLTLGLLATALCLSIGCGDDDDDNGATGGAAGAAQGGKAGASSGGKAGATSGGKAGAGSGGKSSGGAAAGGNTSGGENPGGAGGVGGTLSEGGVGGVPVTPPPVMCTPPAAPLFGEGGAANAGGADGSGGALESAGAGGAHNGSPGIVIRGSFSDSWGSHHVITNSTWTSGSSVFHISQVDNGAKYLIARNDQGNTWNPCLWSRFDWTRSEGKLYYCQTAYNAATEAAALSTPPADPSDPATSGCGGFSWTELLPE